MIIIRYIFWYYRDAERWSMGGRDKVWSRYSFFTAFFEEA